MTKRSPCYDCEHYKKSKLNEMCENCEKRIKFNKENFDPVFTTFENNYLRAFSPNTES